MIDESNPTTGTKAYMDYFYLSIVLLMFAQLGLISHKTSSAAIEVGKLGLLYKWDRIKSAFSTSNFLLCRKNFFYKSVRFITHTQYFLPFYDHVFAFIPMLMTNIRNCWNLEQRLECISDISELVKQLLQHFPD